MPENNGNIVIIADEFDENTFEGYILGQLSDSDQERFEAAYFADDLLFEKYSAFKLEMLDLYARGELAEEKRRKVESHFLATAPRRRRVAEAKEFISSVTAYGTRRERDLSIVEPTRLSIFKYFKVASLAWAAVLLAVVAGVSWLVTRDPQRFEPEVAQVEIRPSQILQDTASAERSPVAGTPLNQSQDVPNAEPVGREPHSERQPDISRNRSAVDPAPSARPGIAVPAAAITLHLVATRGEGSGNTLTIYSDTTRAVIDLARPPVLRTSYSAVIETLAGEVRWKADRIRPARGSGGLKLMFDPKSLKSGDYTITLRTTSAADAEVISEYYFRVEHSQQNTPSLPK
jgi:hypothetical protein